MSDNPFADFVAQNAQAPAAPSAAPQSDNPFADYAAKNQQETAQQAEEANRAPNWSEIPGRAASNFGTSAGKFVSDMAQPFLHPVQTAQDIGNVGHGLAQRLGVAPEGGHEDEKYWDAVKEHFKGKYGSMENFKRSLAEDPVGVAGDLSVLFTGGGGAAARLPGIAGRVGEIAGTVGRAIDPLTVPVKSAELLGQGLKKAATASAVGITGAPMKSLEKATEVGYEGGEANKAFKESAADITTPEEIVDNAKKGVDNITKEKNLDYTQRKALWGQSQQPMSYNDIGQAIRDAHQVQEYKGVDLLDPRGAKFRKSLDNTIIDWMQQPHPDFHTAAGFDALKKKIGNLRDAYELGTPERKIGDMYYKAVGDTIKKQVPEYANAMERYAEYSNQLNELRKGLSLNDKATIDTALRKLTSTQRKNVNTNFGQRARMLDELEAAGSKNLGAQLAGQALKSNEPAGLHRLVPAIAAGTGHFGEAALAALASPRAAGRAFNAAGSLPRVTGLKYVPKKQVLRAARVAGEETPDNGDRLYVSPQRARGGKVDRAMRAVKKHG